MILHCDTSALVKVYVAEARSDEMNRHLAEAEAAAVADSRGSSSTLLWLGAAVMRRTIVLT